MFLDHQTKFYCLFVGLVISLALDLGLQTLEWLLPVHGVYMLILHSLTCFIPVMIYVNMNNALEDCFDCFNRTKDQFGGAQALSIF
jgi:hypothetical protein